MWRSKHSWIAFAILIPFIIIWIKEGFGWAIAALIIMGMLFLMLAGTSRRRRYYYCDDDDYREVIVERRTRTPHSSFNKAMDWHVPRVNKKGVEFLTGSRRQQDDMKRIRRKLWG